MYPPKHKASDGGMLVKIKLYVQRSKSECVVERGILYDTTNLLLEEGTNHVTMLSLLTAYLFTVVS
jgi:hypothetical protein